MSTRNGACASIHKTHKAWWLSEQKLPVADARCCAARDGRRRRTFGVMLVLRSIVVR
jgi:hypothetical protein